ncbi:hypothetical protein [Deinococcus xinjiangensis]|uniref:hypothetical protein n=1 Tax=Deinococcus xinjiangensis TaxID=457454 RepID=UPI00336555F1
MEKRKVGAVFFLTSPETAQQPEKTLLAALEQFSPAELYQSASQLCKSVLLIKFAHSASSSASLFGHKKTKIRSLFMSNALSVLRREVLYGFRVTEPQTVLSHSLLLRPATTPQAHYTNAT